MICICVYYFIQLMLEGMISTDSRSQIAVDEIILSDGLCSGTGQLHNHLFSH